MALCLAALVTTLPLAPPPPLRPLLSFFPVNTIGLFFVRSLMEIKHNGATERLSDGLQATARRVLACNDDDLATLPAQWLNGLLNAVKAPGQSRTSIVRRSAGLPSAVLALCLAEAGGAARALLPAAAERLLRVATGDAVWPRVHAFNCLRLLFDSAALAADASPFVARGIEACLAAMLAPEWEVRAGPHVIPSAVATLPCTIA